jgi:hypothetical protein
MNTTPQEHKERKQTRKQERDRKIAEDNKIILRLRVQRLRDIGDLDDLVHILENMSGTHRSS